MFEELLPLQNKHLEILTYIDDFCEKNDIQYCLAYGSALGARRHGGSIPWDDDVDIYLPSEDYHKFKTLFGSSGDHDRFYFQEMMGSHGMAYMSKLRMNGTAVIEESFKNWDMHQGIYVDLYEVHDAPPKGFGRLLGNCAEAYLTIKKLSNTRYHKRKIVAPLLAFLRLFPKNFGVYTCLKLRQKYDGTNQPDVALWETTVRNKNGFMPKNYLFPPKKMDYMGKQLYVPGKIDEYLERIYGSWQEIPSMDKIQWAQHASIWSITEDFRAFCPNIRDFSDEYHDEELD